MKRSWAQWLSRAFRGSKSRRSPRRLLQLEHLEDRLAPAVGQLSNLIVVTTTADDTAVDGAVSLREAILSINQGSNVNPDVNATGTYGNNNTIQFAIAGTPTITLTADLPALNQPVTIDGTSQPGLTIDGNGHQVFVNNSGVTLTSLTITGGHALNGGGVDNESATLTLNNCTVVNNTATSDGGGIENNGGTVYLNNSTVQNNTASGNGGGIENANGGTVFVESSTIALNHAGGHGGGVDNGFSVSFYATNSTIASNTAAGDGGGIDNAGYNASVFLTDATVALNQAGGNGGGLTNAGYNSSLILEDALVAGNTVSSGSSGPDVFTSTTGQSPFGNFSAPPDTFADHSLIGDGTEARLDSSSSQNQVGPVGGVPIDPLLGPLHDNGGPTQTMALLPGSPAIGAGIATGDPSQPGQYDPGSGQFVYPPITTDQRGFSRPSAPGEATDIGAFQTGQAAEGPGSGTVNWTWTGLGGDGRWDNPQNWSATPGADWSGGLMNEFPGQGTISTELDNATIDTDSTTATISIQLPDRLLVQDLTTGASDSLAITGGSLTVAATSTLNGPLSMTGGSLSVSGSGVTLTVNGTTTLSAGNLTAEGGATLSLPALTSYANPNTNDSATWTATGAGSELDLSSLTSLGTLSSPLDVTATQGGHINLSALPSNGSAASLFFDTDGSGSQIDLSAATNLAGAQFTWRNGGTALLGQLASLSGGSLTVDNATVTLTALTDVDGSILLVQDGGTLSLPSLTSDGNPTTFFASGAGSVLDVSALSTVGSLQSHWSVLAQSGGEVNLSGLANLPATQIATLGYFSIEDGGTIDFPAGAATMPTAASAAATITVPSLPQGVTLNLSGKLKGATFDVAPGATVDLTGGTFSGTTTFNVAQGSTVAVTGGPTISGTWTGTGAGTVQFNSNRVYIGPGGLTLNFPGSLFQWVFGVIDAGRGDLTNLGTINLPGPSGKYFYNDGVFDNFGTVIQTGGGLQLGTDGIYPTTLRNEAGASYLIEGDSGISEIADTNPSAVAGQLSIDNRGTIRKVSGTAASTLLVYGVISNTGTLEVDSGTLSLAPASVRQVSGGTLTGGTWKALGGATLTIPTSTGITANQGDVTLSGAGAKVNGLSTLAANTGSFTITSGAHFSTAGDFANSGSLTVGPGSTLAVTGNYTQTSSGTLYTQLGGTPASGQFGQVAVTGTAALAGGFGVSLVNGFGPSSGQDFQPLTFAGATGGFSSLTGLNPFFTASLGATSFDLVDNSANAVDLVLTGVTAPVTATAGQPIMVNWQVSNPGGQDASGNWQDSVYLSATPAITSSSILLGAVKHSGGLGASGSYSGTWSGAVPALPPGYYYVLVQTDSLYQVADPDRSNNTQAASTGQLNVSVPALTLGTPLSDSFTAAGQDHYYQVTVPAGGSLEIALASAASSGALALYVGQGTLPTPYSYQQAAAVPNQPNQAVTLPVPAGGTYYILVHSVAGAAATAGYTLTASQTSALGVSGISSSSGGNAGNVTVEIDGTNFTPETTASLTLGGTIIPAATVYFVSVSQVYATFDLSGAALGNYTLTVSQGAQTATAPTPVQVVPGTAVPLSVTLSAPQSIRPGHTGTLTVLYTNLSNNDMVAPLLDITAGSAHFSFATPDNPNAFTQSTDVLAVAPSGPAGILRPGQSGTLTLTVQADSTTPSGTTPVIVNAVDASQKIDWASLQPVLQPAGVPGPAWDVVWNNLLRVVGNTEGSFNAALARAATYLGGVGETTAQVGDPTRLWAFLESQADASYPTLALAPAVDAALATSGGLGLGIDRTFGSDIDGRSVPDIFGLGWSTSWETSLSTDASGNVTINAGGALTYFAQQPGGSYVPTTGEYGTLTRAGGVYTYTNPHGQQSVFLPNGLLGYEQDGNGNRVTLGYNPQAQLVSLTWSNPSVPSEQLTLTYNAQGLVSQVADSTGRVWTYTYDAAGHLLSVNAPGNRTTSYTYDTSGNPATANALLSVTYPNGSQEQFTYDPGTGRLTGSSHNGGANAVTYTYPGEGEVIATDAAGHQTISWFNDLGQPARVQDALGGISSYAYDLNGNLLSFTNPLGATYQYAYDRGDNLTQIVNPLGQTVRMTYDGQGNLTSLTNAAGATTQYQYSSAGNLLAIVYPDGTHRSFTYDPLGNLSETVLRNGDPIHFQHNAQGQTTQEAFADGTSQTMTYDAQGNLLTASTYDAQGNLTGTTTLTYNDVNELTSITYPTGQHLAFTYDPATGQRTQSVDQSGYVVNYSYDGLGRLSELTDGSNNLIVRYSYNDLGQVQKKLNGNGTSTTYAYDAGGNLTQEINYAPDGSVNSSFAYTYDARGEQTSLTDAAGTTTYGYDALGQLTSVNLPDGQSILYVYDAAGNRTQVVTGGAVTGYTSNADNEITQVGSNTYTYDQNGNLHTVTGAGGTTTYTYNDLNQLVSISAPDGTVTTYQYNPLGFLVGTTVSNGATSSQTNYLVDPAGPGSIVAASNGDGSLIADYTYGLGLVSQSGPSGTGYYDFDGSGNTRAITDGSGAYVNQYRYLPFGETTIVSAGLPNPFRFAGAVGALSDGSGLVHMRARDYDPVTGQFTSDDPLSLAGGDTNVRRYAQNSPTTLLDPLGTDGLPYIGVTAPSNGRLPLNDAWGNMAASSVAPAHMELFNPDGTSLGVKGIGDNNGAQVRSEDPSGYTPVVGFQDPAILQAAVQQTKAETAQYQQNSAANYDIFQGLFGNKFGTPSNQNCQTYQNRILYNYLKLGGRPVFYNIGYLTGVLQWPLSSQQRSAFIFQLAFLKIFQVVRSQDPNALVGPAGYGDQGFIQPGGTWPYTVDFENDGSAAAQTVSVSEQLDPNLDWSTFQLGSFGWGPIHIAVPAGLTQYQTTVSYQNSDGTPLNVQVALDFNVQTGLLTASFTSLDPSTGQAPDGAFDGFLYPEGGTGVGDGFVQYTIQPQAGLATGTTITQQASVVFDTNDPLATAPFVNTIDSGTPTSRVHSLPASEPPTGFTVAWSGQDDNNGSGIASFAIYVSDNGGPFTLWQSFPASQTSATFTGAVGHTYAFYSVATDNVGNVQPTPAAAQATTLVQATPTITWSNPTDITYGTALSSTQLSATANVPGTFSYTPAAGTLLSAGPGQTLSATFTPTDTTDYTTATAQVSLNVQKATPTVSITDKGGSYTGNPFPVIAASVVGIAQDGTLATLGDPSLSYRYYAVGSEGSLTLLSGAPSAPGSYQVVAHYSGSSNYTAADSLPVRFSIIPNALPPGSWQGVYGTDGYDLAQGGANFPGYAQVSLSGASNWVWDYSPTDPRALQDGSGGRLAATWYSNKSFSVNVNLTDGLTHRLTLYLVDWDSRGRKEQVDVIQAGRVVSSQTVANFTGGQYLSFALSGPVTLRFNTLAGPNAVLSGLFFDTPPAAPVAPTGLTASGGTAQVSLSWTASAGATSYNVYRGTSAGGEAATPVATGLTVPSYTDTGLSSGTTYYYQVTALNAAGQSPGSAEATASTTPATPSNTSASFVGVDTATQGNWKGTSGTPVYGTQGYSLSQVASNLPNTTATISLSGQSNWVWDYAPSDSSALQTPSGGRLAATWYSNKSFDVDVNLTDGRAHRLTLYLLDYDSRGRKEQVQVLDPATNQVLASQTVSNFSGGKYVSFTVQGHVKVRLSNLAGPNAVLSGLFFDPANP